MSSSMVPEDQTNAARPIGSSASDSESPLSSKTSNAQLDGARYQDIVEEQTELICRYDADFRLTFVNRAYSAAQGQPPAALIGTVFIDKIPAADRAQALARVRALRAEQPTTTSVHPSIMPDGTERLVEWTDRALFDADGRFLEYQGVGRDVTARVAAERAAQRYAQRMEILHQIDLGLIQGTSIPGLADITLKHLRKLIPCQRAMVAIFDAQLVDAEIFALDLAGETALPQGVRLPIRPYTFEGLDAKHMKVISDIRPLREVHPEARQLANEGLISGMQVLLMQQDHPIGQLGLLANTPGFFTAEYQEIAVEIANQLAIAIHQKQLAEALARNAAELEQRVIERTAELQATNDRLTAILNNSRDGILLVDRDLSVLQSNPSFDQLLAAPTAGLPNRNLLDYLDPENAARVRTSAEQAVADQHAAHLEVSAKRQDGATVEVELGIGHIPGDGLVTTVHDVTERKQAEDALRESETRYRLLAENIEDIIMTFSVDRRITYFSPSCEKRLGYLPEEVVGRTHNEFIHPEDFPQVVDRTRQAVVANENAYTSSFRLRHKAGHYIWYEVHTKILRSPDIGQVVNFVSVLRDITERKQAEAALQLALEKEKEVGELKSRFVSIASHEFRNPLAAILATTETLLGYRDRMDKPQIDARLGKIQQAVTHLTSIVEDVLQLSRMQSERVDFEPTTGDLAALCWEIVEEFQSQIPLPDRILYTCAVPELVADYDENLMRRAITNLISNALKYSPIDTPVQVHLVRDPAQIVLTVQDRGIGIPAADLKHLFEPFYRASNVGKVSGTGLGLSITKQSVELHGGTITVESALEQGTTVRISLPYS